MWGYGTTKPVIYSENVMEYVDGEPRMVAKEHNAMLEGVQGDGSAMIYIDTIPYRVPAKRLKNPDGSPLTR